MQERSEDASFYGTELHNDLYSEENNGFLFLHQDDSFPVVQVDNELGYAVDKLLLEKPESDRAQGENAHVR